MLTVTYRTHVNTVILFTYIQNRENVINLGGYSLQVTQIFSPHTSATG